MELKGLRWRLVGPYRGARVVAVAGHPTEPMTFFFGGVGGGVWRTDDGGFTWHNISDGYFKRSSVGALAVSPSHPEILYAGMGECSIIHGQTHGDGVYRSIDGGRSWEHLGLAATHCIGRIRIHPTDPNIVYVAAFGHRFGTNRERGIFRTVDGGKTWEQVLFRSENAGAIDLAINPRNPRIIYAALWEARAYPWTHVSGGADSSIYKSVDGGETWNELTRNPGLPNGTLGKIGIALSPSRPDRLWALIEHASQGGVYRSDDGGQTWTWMDDNRHFQVRASYFCHIVADPQNPDVVYLPNRKLWKSVDGGRSFAQINTPYVDQHDLWVDPQNTRRMILGNDGGASVSLDGGISWSTLVNQPTAEIYRLAVDQHFPYRIYGSQQDNSTLCLPSRSDRGPISQFDWYDIGGGESGFIAVRADDPNIVYSSDLPGLGVTRYDHRTHQLREIGPWSDPDSWDIQKLRYRFNWSVPVVLSPHDPNILYVAGNVVFRSTNEGDSWEIISPDLTRADPTKMMPSGGPVMREDSSADQYGNISSIAESPYEAGVLWVGTNDGLIQLSRDEGRTWQNVTPPNFPEWSLSQVEPSHHAHGKCYVAASGHYLDDFTPYIFKTEDYGQTWTLIAQGIPEGHFVRVVREDPERSGLLYAGTEAGIFFSLDDGESWQPLQTNLPITSVHDLAVKDSDLVAATHGRSIWVLDDLTPLRQLSAQILDHPVHLFSPRPTYRITRHALGLDSLLALYASYAASNPPSGIIVHYYLKTQPTERVTLALLDADGNEIRVFSNDTPETVVKPVGPYAHMLRGGSAALRSKPAGEPELGVKWGALTLPPAQSEIVPTDPGLNRFVLPIQHPGARKIPGLLSSGITAPLLVPGTYRVKLTVGDQSWVENVAVVKDPRVSTTQEAFQAQFELMIRIRDKVTEIHSIAHQCRDLRHQLDERLRPLEGRFETLHTQGRAIREALIAIEEALIQPRLNETSGELDGAHFPVMIDGKLEALGYKVARSDHAPPRQAYAMYEEYSAEAEIQFTRFRELAAREIAAFNQQFQQLGIPALMLPDEAAHLNS